MSKRNSFPHNTNNEQHHCDRDQVAKLVQEEVWQQTRLMAPAPINRPSNSGMPSGRNRRTTDGLPICNKCDKVGHIARNCRAGGLQHHFPQGPNIICISILTCNISPCEYPSTIHTFALPSNIMCISTTLKSVTMLQPGAHIPKISGGGVPNFWGQTFMVQYPLISTSPLHHILKNRLVHKSPGNEVGVTV